MCRSRILSRKSMLIIPTAYAEACVDGDTSEGGNELELQCTMYSVLEDRHMPNKDRLLFKNQIGHT